MKLNLGTLTLGGPHPSEGWSKALKMKWLAQSPATCQQPGWHVSTFTGGTKLVNDIGNHPWAEVHSDETAQNTCIGCATQKMLWPLYLLSFSFLLDIFLFKFLPFISFDSKSLHAYYRDSGICWKVKEREERKKWSEFHQPEAACIIMVFCHSWIHVTEIKLHVEFYVFPFFEYRWIRSKVLKNQAFPCSVCAVKLFHQHTVYWVNV